VTVQVKVNILSSHDKVSTNFWTTCCLDWKCTYHNIKLD